MTRMKWERIGRFMSRVKIITDSVSDMREELSKELDVTVLPLTINLSGKSYLDGVDLKVDELFKIMDETNEFPTTSQINPQRFEEECSKWLKLGYDVLVITMSSKLSGTYNSAWIAKENINNDRLIVIDSLNVTMGQFLLVKKAALMAKEGKSLEEISNLILNTVPKVRSIVAFDTLKMLVRSGRVDKTTAFIGGIVGVKPMVEIKNGFITPIGKERGSKNAINKCIEVFKSANIDKNFNVVIGNSNRQDVVVKFEELCNNLGYSYDLVTIGTVVGCHIGPNAAGFFWAEN